MMVLRLMLVFACLLFCTAAFAAEPIQVPCAIQISSSVSDGKLTITEIIETARKAGIKAVIFADRDLMQWEYGIWPVRNIIKKTVTEKSIFRYGLNKYLTELEGIKKANPDMVLIAGVESAPFYYWQGSVFNDDLTLRDWHKHIVAVGLRAQKDYALLPVIGNAKALALPYSLRSVFLLWPLLLVALGVFLFSRRRTRWGIFAATIGVIFLINNFPFRLYRFDQYHGKQGVRPYQDYFDYVKAKGGLTFWVHPEACNQCRIGNVYIDTEGYPLDFYQTHDYTGFSIFYEGEKTIGTQGGLWDRLLHYYCQGKRKSPVWAIGALGFDQSGDLSAALADLRTVVLSEQFSEDSLLDALRQGRAYVAAGRNSADFILDHFSIVDPASGAERTMGETLRLQTAPLIKLRGHLLRGQPQVFTIQLIKNEAVLKEFQARVPFEISYQDTGPLETLNYYRLVVRGPGLTLVTNPIFAGGKEE